MGWFDKVKKAFNFDDDDEAFEDFEEEETKRAEEAKSSSEITAFQETIMMFRAHRVRVMADTSLSQITMLQLI